MRCKNRWHPPPPLPALERNMKPNKTVQEVPPPVQHILTLTLNKKNLHILCFAANKEIFFMFMLFFIILHCWQITATHQINLNNRPVGILVGDIYSPRTILSWLATLNNRPGRILVGDIFSPQTILSRLAANTHNRVTPVSRKSITKALFPKK